MKLTLASLILLSSVFTVASQSEPGNAVFWRELQKLCGKAFAGSITADTAPNPDFTGKAMVMHIRSCEANRIRIPFFVGENRSRTWVLTRKSNRIEHVGHGDDVRRHDDQQWHGHTPILSGG